MRHLALLLLLPVTVSAAWIVNSFPAPGGGIYGLGWTMSSLWTVDCYDGFVYRLDPSSGEVLFTFLPSLSPDHVPWGLTCSQDTIFVSHMNSFETIVAMYDATTGSYLGQVYSQPQFEGIMGLSADSGYMYMARQETYTCLAMNYIIGEPPWTYLMFAITFDPIYDIAYQEGDIWMAHDSESEPVRRYDTSGTIVDFLPAELIPSAAGLALDPSGYLWVSDPDADMIYKVDTSQPLSRSTWAGIKNYF